MDRSKRATNPDNFNENKTIKRGVKLRWNCSARYLKSKKQLKELYRKQADIRKGQHELLANEIISLGDTIYVETMNYKGLQSRAKETTVNEKTGRINKKKRFGKSLANKAPAMLLVILDRKLKYHNLSLNKVNTHKIKASQYNHITGECRKKKLSQRWNDFNGIKVQRDLYSSFLLMNVNNDLETINKDTCDNNFSKFLGLHDAEIKRLSTTRTLSSVGF